MYLHILRLLSSLFGEKAELALVAGVGTLAVAVLLLLSGAWRQGVAEARRRGGWRAVVMGLANGLITLIVGATFVAAFGAAMLVQSGLFDERHGQVTQTNYQAIQTNWGQPHEQSELAVAHYVTEKKTFLLLKDGRQVPEDEIGGDEASLVGENPVKVTRDVRKPVPQNSIVSGTVDVDVRLNYRPKGTAFYTCYEDTWRLAYTVKNRSDKATEAEFRFPLPASRGVYNRLTIRVDGKDWTEHLVLKDNAQTWTMPMAAGQEAKVEIGYASRGMEYLRYTPAPMAHRETYKVTMRLSPDAAEDGEPARGPQRFVWEEDMGLPIGSMTPGIRKDSPAAGEPMVLEWDMASVATSLGMGIILPDIKQPGWYVARLLHEAPLGLALLAATLVITWMLLGRGTHLFSLGLLVVAYYLFYTILAYLSDHMTSFTACFVLAALATLGLSAAYLWMGWGRRFAAHQSLALVAAFTLYYPLAVVFDDWTGLMLQVLYWLLATYAAGLAVVMLYRRRRDRTAEETPEPASA
ncbi:MAG: hypothetical protein ISS74_10375 [Planctomycetes bacterium]|nr:hypothetical protein [Planctomycetota bacterium]